MFGCLFYYEMIYWFLPSLTILYWIIWLSVIAFYKLSCMLVSLKDAYFVLELFIKLILSIDIYVATIIIGVDIWNCCIHWSIRMSCTRYYLCILYCCYHYSTNNNWKHSKSLNWLVFWTLPTSHSYISSPYLIQLYFFNSYYCFKGTSDESDHLY